MINTNYTDPTYISLSRIPVAEQAVEVKQECPGEKDSSVLEKQASSEMQQQRLSLQLHKEVSSLFSTEEKQNIEIGFAIIQERVKLKNAIIAKLIDENLPLKDRLEFCRQEFGGIIFPELLSDEMIRMEIRGFHKYTTLLLET